MEGYFAFISYAREDMDVAGWIHSKLEKYPYPKEFVKEENRPSHPYLIRKIFIDTQDLPVTINKYTDNIRKAISESRYMIVICSEHSASSVHVSEEIRYFLETHEKRGTLIGKIASDHDGFDGVYVDFSSTTSTFSQIIEYKKSKYADIDEDMLVKEYADIDKFIDAIRYKAYYGRN